MEPQRAHTLQLKAYNDEQICFRTKGNSKIDPHSQSIKLSINAKFLKACLGKTKNIIDKKMTSETMEDQRSCSDIMNTLKEKRTRILYPQKIKVFSNKLKLVPVDHHKKY